jgi:hypothetical protein
LTLRRDPVAKNESGAHAVCPQASSTEETGKFRRVSLVGRMRVLCMISRLDRVRGDSRIQKEEARFTLSKKKDFDIFIKRYKMEVCVLAAKLIKEKKYEL